MELQTYSMNSVTESRAMDIISRVGSLAMIGEIGATKKMVADFFKVSERTIERVLESSRSDFLMYGDYKKNRKDIKKQLTDKSVGTLLPKRVSKINLFNRKHIMLFACHLGQSSYVAKNIIQYLIQVESNATKEDKMTAIFEQLIKWDELPDDSKPAIFMKAINSVRESKDQIAFAESVGESASLVSINDFAKATYGTLGLGQRKLFREMRFNGILNHQNKPYQYYINMGYFVVITKVINGKVIYQTKITGKGQVWLLAKMKMILGI
ncbi:hypothetical protein PM10SUCC1_19180 [Propionigenium maris DSM 9537]|uniref:Antirepressor protein C-terminal domain-containing protein n=1 Tax=Propionigenium maris DSM 9537 TaxID=1123000 RepID=A0A9W6LN13_9FUSO|nr:phage antirepressor KilAC domain-containing protein [Propionigenium maris]GLI56404.1 hypothetical protein PM10SUCC1_19180 [Propionigenium maris DSM 9537]